MRASPAPEVRGFSFGKSALAAGVGLLACALSASGARTDSLSPDLLEPAERSKPSFTLPDTAGSPRALVDIGTGVVLVHFWATWCEPCRVELSSLSQLVDQNPDVTVMAINVAEPPVRVRRFLETNPVTFSVLLDENRAVTRGWGVAVLPTTYVLDRSLNIHRVAERDIDWLKPEVVTVLKDVASASSSGTDNNTQQGEKRHDNQ